MPSNKEHLSIEDQIEQDSLVLVGHLHTCCEDAGLQVTRATGDHYAFPALHAQGIEIPDNASHQLFYILFGETICKLADDLEKMPTTNENTAQTLQLRSNEMMAQHLRDQVSSFLEHLTQMFFSGMLHRQLVRQLQKNKHKHKLSSSITTGSSLRSWSFETITANIHEAAHYMRNIKSKQMITGTPWNSKSLSSKKTKDNIISMFREMPIDTAVTEKTPDKSFSLHDTSAPMSEKQAEEKKSSQERRFEGKWGDEEEGGNADFDLSPQIHAKKATTNHLSDNTSEVDDQIDELSESRAIFYPYIQMYERVATYFENGAKHRHITPDHALAANKDLFYENRMLCMCICEEQMHLIQRHQAYVKDYPDSIAWNFLFDMFLCQRQLFAELIVPVGAWQTPLTILQPRSSLRPTHGDQASNDEGFKRVKQNMTNRRHRR
jgi:hypothetical protein